MVPDWEGPKFRVANIRAKSVGGIKAALSLEDRKSLIESLPSKGGFQS